MANIENALVVRMEASLAKFERQMARAREVASGTAVGVEKRFDQMGQRMAQSSTRAAGGLSNVINISSRGRFVLQNTAAQIGDIAVQLESGTAASRVLAQQLPQILGGFGALGGVLGIVAPLLGTVAAVGIPLAAMLLTVGGNSEEAAEKVETFAEKLKDAESSLAAVEDAAHLTSAGGLEDLLKKYGELTEAVRTLAKEQLNMAVGAAKVEVGDVINAALGDDFKAQIDKIFGGVGAAIAGATAEDAEAAKRAYREIAQEIENLQSAGAPVPSGLIESLREAREEFFALSGYLAGAGTLLDSLAINPALLQEIATAREEIEAAVAAGNFTAIADGFALMRDLLRQTGQELDQGVLDTLVNAEDVVRQTAARFGEAATAASDTASAAGGIGDALSSGVSAAAQLATNLGISLETARRLANLGPQGGATAPDPSGKVYSGRGGDPRQFGGSAYDISTAGGASFLENWKPPKAGGGGGGGGGGVSQFEKDAQRAKQIIESTKTATEKYSDSIAELNALQSSGHLTAEQAALATERLGEKFLDAEKGARSLGDTFASAFADILTGASSAKDAVAQLAGQLARMFAERGFQMLFSGIGGGGGGLLGGSIIPGILHGGGVAGSDGYGHGRSVPASLFAHAPRYHNGGIAGLRPNEVPAILERGETVLPKGAGERGMDVRVFVDQDGNWQAAVERISGRVTAVGMSQYDRSLPSRVAGISRDPRARR